MATVSGTVSEATGGKFANGAMTGAFIHMFNAEGGFRKLEGMFDKVYGTRGSMLDMKDMIIGHEGFILNDGTAIVFFSDGMVRVDTGYTSSDYSQLQYYDEGALLQAIGETYIGNYDLVHNNCQNWAARVTYNYNRINGN